MIVYSETKDKFQDDVFGNRIDEVILKKFFETTGHTVGDSERGAFKNSLGYMDKVLNDPLIPNDSKISIEYHIPRSSKRIDFIISGLDSNKKESVLIIELKQWSHAEKTDMDAIVRTRFKHGLKEVSHPSYQAWSYKKLIEDYNEFVENNEVRLIPCAYLHNYEDDGVISDSFYDQYIKEAPLFLKDDARKLREFIKEHIKYGDSKNILYSIDNGRIRPSKSLVDELASMLSGNKEFVMIDDQKVVYENALKLSSEVTDYNKKVLIVNGGPGTGKTVVAINLLVELTGRKLVAQYISKNSAPREVFKVKLTGTFKQTHISNLFSGSGAFHSTEQNLFDVLVVDEAHRLNAKSGMFSHLGENQVKEIIKSSRLSIFFLDEDQKVTLKDIGGLEEIRKQAESLGVDVIEMKLESQFRCNGSDGYLAWLDNALQIRATANEDISDLDYDFQIMESPSVLHDMILKKNLESNNKARLVAGYCWDWVSKKDKSKFDIIIDDYKAKWNLNEHGQSWIIKPDSASEIGCIHTCQGLEVDYVGVIIGPDLIVRKNTVVTVPEKRSKTDKSITGWKKLKKEKGDEFIYEKLDSIIKNTYRTLMTRGMKGCYVYFTDKETEEYFKNILKLGKL